MNSEIRADIIKEIEKVADDCIDPFSGKFSTSRIFWLVLPNIFCAIPDDDVWTVVVDWVAVSNCGV